MNYKRTILYFLLGILALIFGYNYILPAVFFPNSGGFQMGRGMHMGEGVINSNIYYYNDFTTIIFLAIIVLAVFMLFDRIFFKSNQQKCKKCGLPVENSEWKICPRCGNRL